MGSYRGPDVFRPRLPPELEKHVRSHAQAVGVTPTELVRATLWRWAAEEAQRIAEEQTGKLTAKATELLEKAQKLRSAGEGTS